MNKRLSNHLVKAMIGFDTEIQFKIGIANDILLKIILKRIDKNPSLDNFIMFTNSLNFFYSTRLQAAVNEKKRKLKTKNKIIIEVAKYLMANWDGGLILSEEKEKKTVNTKSVEKMRKELKKNLGRGSYSFSTKVFHQLYSNYPIVDTNVNTFMQKEGYKTGISFYNPSTPYSTFFEYYKTMMMDLGWSHDDVDNFDTALWMHVANNERKYFPSR